GGCGSAAAGCGGGLLDVPPVPYALAERGVADGASGAGPARPGRRCPVAESGPVGSAGDRPYRQVELSRPIRSAASVGRAGAHCLAYAGVGGAVVGDVAEVLGGFRVVAQDG